MCVCVIKTTNHKTVSINSKTYLFESKEYLRLDVIAHDRCALQQLALNVHVKP